MPAHEPEDTGALICRSLYESESHQADVMDCASLLVCAFTVGACTELGEIYGGPHC